MIQRGRMTTEMKPQMKASWWTELDAMRMMKGERMSTTKTTRMHGWAMVAH